MGFQKKDRGDKEKPQQDRGSGHAPDDVCMCLYHRSQRNLKDQVQPVDSNEKPAIIVPGEKTNGAD